MHDFDTAFPKQHGLSHSACLYGKLIFPCFGMMTELGEKLGQKQTLQEAKCAEFGYSVLL